MLMDDKELLEAMRAIQADTLEQIDKKLEKQNQQINEKLEKQSQRLLDEFNIVIEDKVSHEIRIIAEGHMDIIERLPNVSAMDDMKSRIRTLERIVKEHSQTINHLKQAQ